MCAAVRAGCSRRSAIASSNSRSGVAFGERRGAGTSASNPPSRYQRIQRSSVLRETRTHPSGFRCSRAASARTSAPRSRADSDTSVASLITRQRNNPISCALSIHRLLTVIDTNERPGSRSLRHRPRRIRVDREQPARGQRRYPRPWRAATEQQRRQPRAHANRLKRIRHRQSPPGRRIKRTVQRPRPQQKVRGDQRRPRSKPPPPIAHRLARHPQPLRDPAIPLPARRQQRRADHLRHIAPARQTHVRQKHMRRTATPITTTPATRPQPPHPRARANHPQPRATPAPQHAHAAARAQQPAGSEIRLDHSTIV